jgi:hypothetical protein
MSDGRVFVIGGSWNGGTGGKNGEVSLGLACITAGLAAARCLHGPFIR